MREIKSFGCLSAAVVILLWGITFASTRVLLEEFSALEIQIGRFAIAWVVLWMMGREKCRVKEGWFAAMGFFGVFTYQLLENCAIYYTSASNVAILVSFGPVVTAVLARIASKDKTLSPRFILGAAVATVGVALVALNGVVNFKLRPLGDLMAVVAMLSWGVYSILLDKVNAMGCSAAVAIRKTFFWALVWMLPLGLWGLTDSGYTALDGSFSITLDPAANLERFGSARNLIHLGFLGVLASALCFSLWNYACARLGVVKATIGLYLTPIVGVIFAALVLGEKITVMSALGGVVIIAGVALSNRKGSER